MEGDHPMRRFLGIAVGVLVQILFAVTSYYNYVFLQGTAAPRPLCLGLGRSVGTAVRRGSQPALVARRAKETGAIHLAGFLRTVLLHGRLRDALAHHDPMASRRLGPVAAQRLVAAAVQALYLSCWGTLFYSLCCSGFGYHTGFHPWWYWVRRQPIPRRAFQPRGAFSVIRHPGYMSFLGLIWFTPDMTIDRAVLVAMWTVYIFVGSYLKDLRLLYYVGNAYREYRARVPGYVALTFGPLILRRDSSSVACRG